MDISLVGWTGKANFGDDYLEIAIIKFFTDIGCRVKSHKEKDYHFYDTVVIGGGNIINEKFHIFKDIAKLKNKKLIFFNVGLNKDSLLVLEKVKNLDTIWVVRDNWSVEFLKSKGFSNVHFAPDICLYSFKQENVTKSRLVSVICNYYIFKKVFSNDFKDKIYAERAYKELANFLLWLKTFDWSIQLLPAQTALGVDDRVTNAYLYGLLDGKAKMIYDNKYLVNDLSKSSMIISSRYHTTIYSLANDIPFIDLTFDDKTGNLIKDIGLTYHSLSYYNFTQEELIRNINEIENNHFQQEKIQEYRVKGEQDWELVKQQIIKYIYG